MAARTDQSPDEIANRLLDDAALDQSPTVANSAMNRDRGIRGVNSYARELGFDIIEFLSSGAPNDQAGPNFSKQPGVDSFYAF